MKPKQEDLMNVPLSLYKRLLQAVIETCEHLEQEVKNLDVDDESKVPTSVLIAIRNMIDHHPEIQVSAYYCNELDRLIGGL